MARSGICLVLAAALVALVILSDSAKAQKFRILRTGAGPVAVLNKGQQPFTDEIIGIPIQAPIRTKGSTPHRGKAKLRKQNKAAKDSGLLTGSKMHFDSFHANYKK